MKVRNCVNSVCTKLPENKIGERGKKRKGDTGAYRTKYGMWQSGESENGRKGESGGERRRREKREIRGK